MQCFKNFHSKLGSIQLQSWINYIFLKYKQVCRIYFKGNIMNVLDYYNKFECIGSECEDSCCKGWTVTIDKKTYRKYKNIPDLPFRKEVLTHIVHDRRAGMGGGHKVKLDKDKSCPFLNEDKICNIYQKYGKNYLSNTCTIFPRNRRYFFNLPESALSLGCPEVTRLAILPG